MIVYISAQYRRNIIVDRFSGEYYLTRKGWEDGMETGMAELTSLESVAITAAYGEPFRARHEVGNIMGAIPTAPHSCLGHTLNP
eukprot:1139421-Pelagomonas_calceolata.AAC.8